MLHLWLQLYGLNPDGAMLTALIDTLMNQGELRFGFAVLNEVPDPPPAGMLIGLDLMASREAVMSSSTPGTHVLAFGFVAENEFAAMTGMLLGAAISHGDVHMKATIQDHHVRENPVPAHLRGTQALFWEIWVKPGVNGGPPTVELPLPSGPSH